VLALFFGDIGFDRPGRFGFDFSHFLVLMSLLLFSFVAAVVIICRNKRWKYLVAQLVLLIAAAAGIAAN
jgi:hypothetical protein